MARVAAERAEEASQNKKAMERAIEEAATEAPLPLEKDPDFSTFMAEVERQSRMQTSLGEHRNRRAPNTNSTWG